MSEPWQRLSRLLNWWPVIVGAMIIGAGCLIAYSASSSNLESPLDALSTAGTLLFSLFLVFIYYKQNEILSQHEEILKKQQQVQEASELKPIIRPISWKARTGSLNLKIINDGQGDAFGLQLRSRISIDGKSHEYKSHISDRVRSDEKIEKDVDFLFSDPSDSTGISFVKVTKEIAEYIDGEAEGDIPVEIELAIEYQDTTEITEEEVLISTSLEISTVGRLRGGLSGNDRPELRIENVYHRPEFDDIGVQTAPAGDIGLLGFKIANKGNVNTTVRFQLLLSYWEDDEWKLADQCQQVSGWLTEVAPTLTSEDGTSKELGENEEWEVVSTVKMDIEGNQELSTAEFIERIREESDIEGVRLQLKIRSDVGYRMSSSRVADLYKLDMTDDGLVSQQDSTAIQSDDQRNLVELFEQQHGSRSYA